MSIKEMIEEAYPYASKEVVIAASLLAVPEFGTIKLNAHLPPESELEAKIDYMAAFAHFLQFAIDNPARVQAVLEEVVSKDCDEDCILGNAIAESFGFIEDYIKEKK